MPIIRDEIFEPLFPHIYEVYFSVNGSKTISYIGKSSGENVAYISGSSELNRVIANTVLCFGEEMATSGWHKVVLAKFPFGTKNSVIEAAEKRLILAAYDECRRLGPGRSWEILNKEYLQRAWKSDAKPVLTKLRGNCEWQPDFMEGTHLDRKSESISKSIAEPPATVEARYPIEEAERALVETEGPPSIIEANFLQRATKELGRSVPVPISLIAYPGLKRSSIKLRILLCVIVTVQKSHRIAQHRYVLKTSTLRYLLREPNLTHSRARDAFAELSSAVNAQKFTTIDGFSSGDSTVRFQITCDLTTNLSPISCVPVEFVKFITVASQGPQAAFGRRFFGILAADQNFRQTGKGIAVRVALSILSGKDVSYCEEIERLRELHSSCIKGLKTSESLLSDALGSKFATNYFTKKKLRRIEAEFKSTESDFRVLFDNAEQPLSDFIALVSDV